MHPSQPRELVWRDPQAFLFARLASLIVYLWAAFAAYHAFQALRVEYLRNLVWLNSVPSTLGSPASWGALDSDLVKSGFIWSCGISGLCWVAHCLWRLRSWSWWLALFVHGGLTLSYIAVCVAEKSIWNSRFIFPATLIVLFCAMSAYDAEAPAAVAEVQ